MELVCFFKHSNGCRPALYHFEFVADDLDEATHSSVDQTVLYIGDDPNEQRLSLLLLAIIANSNGKLNPKYEMMAAAVTTSGVANRANASMGCLIVQKHTKPEYVFSIAVVGYRAM